MLTPATIAENEPAPSRLPEVPAEVRFVLGDRHYNTPDLHEFCRRIGRMLNKGELVHSLARQVAYGQLGILTDRDLTSQLNRATCLSLLLNVIAVWNTRYMQAALDHLRATGYRALESDLEHRSPIVSGHINLHGSHHFDLLAPKKRQGQLRPLRTAEPSF